MIFEKIKQNICLNFIENMSEIDDTAPKRGKFEQNREIYKFLDFKGFEIFPQNKKKTMGTSNSRDLVTLAVRAVFQEKL